MLDKLTAAVREKNCFYQFNTHILFIIMGFLLSGVKNRLLCSIKLKFIYFSNSFFPFFKQILKKFIYILRNIKLKKLFFFLHNLG